MGLCGFTLVSADLHVAFLAFTRSFISKTTDFSRYVQADRQASGRQVLTRRASLTDISACSREVLPVYATAS